MSKMKHLLRKLHIGGTSGNTIHHPHQHRLPTDSPPSSNPTPTPIPDPDPPSSSSNSDRTVVDVSNSSNDAAAVDFNLMVEEEFQVQLALAMSASDHGSRVDSESAQIDAAKLISLGCCSETPVGGTGSCSSLVDSLSFRYWSYNVINYDEKVMDGFYDVYDISSNSVVQGNMPLLVDLQALLVSDNVNYEVILVNHLVDTELRELEKRAYVASLETQVFGGMFVSGLTKKIADIVVAKMGGPVDDADELSSRWTRGRFELRNALSSIIFPLGSLDIGLSRHRALLFKVLADRIGLPCMLVKGSFCTGTDDGAVNFVKLEDGSEYIIDLMGAPGTLIPAEVPISRLLTAGYDTRSFGNSTETPQCAHLFVAERSQTLMDLDSVQKASSSISEEGLLIVDSCQEPPVHVPVPDVDQCLMATKGRILNVEQAEEYAEELIEAADCSVHNGCDGCGERINPELGEVSDWEIPWGDLRIGERIGIGSCGEVYRADLNGTEVAVKKFLDQDISGDALLQFKCEAEIMLRLRHPNVVLFMGAVTRPPHLSILTEYLPRGSLYKLLHRASPQLDEKRRMKMALDVAKGMNYLHTCQPPIVHRDLKTPNLLVDKNWVVKVSDFGMSRMKPHTFLSSKSTAGTAEWMAPEVLRNEPANEKCDVYSFGVILWELATCEIPWKSLNSMQVVGAVGFQNRHLEIPASVNPAIAQIIRDCWQVKPQLRPSFTQIISCLRRVQRLSLERLNHTNQTTQ